MESDNMSKRIFENDQLILTSFWSGPAGKCLQLTMKATGQYVTFDKTEINNLKNKLEKWTNDL